VTKRRHRGSIRANKPARPIYEHGNLLAENENLRRELAAAQQQLEQVAREGTDAYTRKRIEALDDARLTARGQALEASLERNKAVGELQAFRDAIAKVSGLTGWLIRRKLAKFLTSP